MCLFLSIDSVFITVLNLSMENGCTSGLQISQYPVWSPSWLALNLNSLIPEKKTTCYSEQISLMMHAFGDVEQPSNDTVELLHNIMLGQMDLLIKNCIAVMKHRGAKEISHQDVLFLMRRNKVMLKRLLQFLYGQDIKRNLLPGFEEYLDNEHLARRTGRVYTCVKFLAVIEKSPGDLQFLLNDKRFIDHVSRMRLERRSFMASEIISDEQNKHFEDALKVSIYNNCSQPEKFKTWLKDNSGSIYDIQDFALSIIEFLAIETVAGLVEKALYMRWSKLKSYEVETELIPHLKLKCPIKQLVIQDSEISPSLKKFIGSPFSTSLPDIEDYESKYPSNGDSIQYEHPSLFIPSKTKCKPEFLPKDPLTPHEIRAAFVDYQRLNPITLLMKKKFPYDVMKKVNIVCLAFPEEEFSEIWKD